MAATAINGILAMKSDSNRWTTIQVIGNHARLYPKVLRATKRPAAQRRDSLTLKGVSAGLKAPQIAEFGGGGQYAGLSGAQQHMYSIPSLLGRFRAPAAVSPFCLRNNKRCIVRVRESLNLIVNQRLHDIDSWI